MEIWTGFITSVHACEHGDQSSGLVYDIVST
jgi:hypothetical protein